MNCAKDPAENSIIEGLEALLCSDEPENSNMQRAKTNVAASYLSWNENSELSRDSLFGFSNASLKSRHAALSNVEYSMESRSFNQSFDPTFFAIPSVKNVSYDGCFIEGDSGIFLNQGNNTSFKQVLKESNTVLSKAISRGGDLNIKGHTAMGVQDAYTFTKYVIHLRKTWQHLCTLNELWTQLLRQQEENMLPTELSLQSIVICLTSFLVKLQKTLVTPKLSQAFQEIRNYLDLASSIARTHDANWKCLQHVSKIARILILILSMEIHSRDSKSCASQDFFRSQQALQVWNDLA